MRHFSIPSQERKGGDTEAERQAERLEKKNKEKKVEERVKNEQLSKNLTNPKIFRVATTISLI